MSDDEVLQVGAKLDTIWHMKGQEIGVDQKLAIIDALMPYPVGAVLMGLDAHVRDPERGKFMPMPSDVVAQIDRMIQQDGRPAPEEAWAIAVPSRDERETVVWTEEIAMAWEVAWPVLQLRDEVGARVAFRDTYRRLVDEARHARRPIRWFASEGHDASRRQIALQAAVRLGRLREGQVEQLPAPRETPLLLGGIKPSLIPDRALEAIDKFRQIVAAKSERPGADGLAKQRTAEMQTETAQRVEVELERRATGGDDVDE